MAKYLYRITLVAVEATQAKSRTKNLGILAQLETNNKREATAEIERLQEMISRESWQVASQVIAERSEISDFAPVDIDTLEPHSSNMAGEAVPADDVPYRDNP